MQTFKMLGLLSLAGGAGLYLICGCAKTASAQEKSIGPLGREEITLTVYADDFAQVGERRPFELAAGTNRLHIGEVSRSMDPSSTLFDWSDPGLQVVSNTYDLGVGNQQNLMKRYLGQEIELISYGENGRPGERKTGRLELVNEQGIVVRTDDKLVVNPGGTLVAPAKPDLVTMPQLSLGVESAKPGKAQLDLTYLTRGLSWSADYVLTLDPNSEALKMECWATVTNQTGVDYPTSKVTLMAGSPNRAARVPVAIGGTWMAGDADQGVTFKAREMSQFQMPAISTNFPQSSGELYAYPIASKVTIAQDQLNRVLMLAGDEVKVKKDYSVRLDRYYGYYRKDAPINATLALAFYNKKDSGLGLPLPNGTVRVYEPAEGTGARYIGAAGIRDTAVDGRIDLTLSNVFDVTAMPKLVSTTKMDKRRSRQTYEVKLSNQKNSPVELRVVKSLGTKWAVENESDKSSKLDAYTAQWKVQMPAKSEKVLKFVVVVG